MEYIIGNFLIISDFEIRILREEGPDIDLFIPLNLRTLNLHIEDLPSYINGRIQFPEVRSIIARFTKLKDEELCTIHLLKNIDIQSAIVNFEMNYKKHYIKLVQEEYSVEMYLNKKEF